jgi:outer membrane protein insertion porin family
MNATRRRCRPLLFALAAALATPATAAEVKPSPPVADAPVRSPMTFEVADIRVDGLQRIGAGTVFTYLPIERGDRIDAARIAEAMRALYKTGFFEDIRFDREGPDPARAILVVTLVERPAINTVELSGNKDIKTEDLMRNLKEIGIADGETYDRLALDRVVLELQRAYNNRGKYNVDIAPEVKTLDRNRVDIKIAVDEGKAARIRHINLVGNEIFDEEALRRDWESNESNWLSWYRRDDQYSREKLSGDLEKLNAFYLDRGHVDFSVDSTQIAVGPDKRDVYISASVSEGEVYRYAGIDIVGDTVLSKEHIQRYVLVREGQVFSRTLLELSADSITAALGNIGHAFAEVTPMPEVDRDKRTVGIRFQVVPGPRVTVRRIGFKGNTRTTDEVLRREMRQFEGAWYSQAAIDRSKVRLQRLGFFENGSIEIESVPVAEKGDQVDLQVKVVETSSGQFQAGVGFQQESGLSINFQLAQRNYLGTGRGFSLNIARSDTTRQAGFTVSEPYFDDLGIGVGYSVYSARTRQDDDDDSSYDSDQGRANVTATLPLSESNALELMGGWETQTLYLTEGYYPQSWTDFLGALGDNRIDTWQLKANWSSDTRNDFLVPTAGGFHSLGLEVSLPGSTAQYYKLDYRFGRYMGLGPLNLFARAEFGYGDGYGDASTRLACRNANGGTVVRPAGDRDAYTDADCGTDETFLRTISSAGLPFYENFYLGGGRSLRGFRDNSLGPCEFVTAYDDCRPAGGSLKTMGSLELTAPSLFGANARGTRLALFLDAGNVFDGIDGFDSAELRASAGLSLLWRSPMGPISISYGLPLRTREGDDIERLQFSFGGQQ